MAECACLMRSSFHPSEASREFRVGDPMRALTESISFGRHMVEPLAWDKWSSFSRNRHLEEIERFARPGSVAEKKALFEAHYRKKSVMKQTPPSNTKEANAATSIIQTPDCCSSIFTIEPELATKEKLVSSDEQIEEDDFTVAIDDFTDQLNNLSPTFDISKSETVEASGTESSEQGLIEDDLPQHSTEIDGSECANRSLEKKIIDKISSSSREEMEQKVVSSSMLLIPDAKEAKLIQPRKGNYNVVQSKEKRPVVNLSDNKKLASKSVHLSMNFGSSILGTSTAMSPVLKQIKKIKDITASLKLQRESLVSRKTPTRASVDLKPNLSSVGSKAKAKVTLEESETRRTRPLQNREATSESIASKNNSHLHSKENSKPPSANAFKPQVHPIACTPFRFRSEDRAAKRKEFFQKQEEKRNSNDAEKIQIHGSCKKTRTRSQSPKFTPKPLHATTQDTKSQKKNLSNANDDNCSMKVKTNSSRRGMRASVISLPRKTVYENASLFIQC